jgi:hypothetical protein
MLVPTSCPIRPTCPWVATCKPTLPLALGRLTPFSASSYLGLGFLPFKLGFSSHGPRFLLKCTLIHWNIQLSVYHPINFCSCRSRLIFASLLNTTDIRIRTSVSFTVDWCIYPSSHLCTQCTVHSSLLLGSCVSSHLSTLNTRRN